MISVYRSFTVLEKKKTKCKKNFFIKIKSISGRMEVSTSIKPTADGSIFIATLMLLLELFHFN